MKPGPFPRPGHALDARTGAAPGTSAPPGGLSLKQSLGTAPNPQETVRRRAKRALPSPALPTPLYPGQCNTLKSPF